MTRKTFGLMELLSMGAVVVLVAVAVAAPAGAESQFRGPKACKKCHIKQYKSWEDTKMSQAFELLKPGARADAKKAAGLDPAKDYSADAKCVGCHVTGYNKPGGYGSGGDDTVLQGVSCEMCHGAAGDWLAKELHSNDNKHFKVADLEPLGFIAKPAMEQCSQCHNDNSPFFKDFDFDKRKDQGTHEHFDLKYEH